MVYRTIRYVELETVKHIITSHLGPSDEAGEYDSSRQRPHRLVELRSSVPYARILRQSRSGSFEGQIHYRSRSRGRHVVEISGDGDTDSGISLIDSVLKAFD